MKKSILALFLVYTFLFTGFSLRAQDYNQDGTVTFRSQSFTQLNKDLISGQGMFIPDGPTCPPGCFLDSILVTGFPSGLTYDMANDLTALNIIMEHSFAGDLGFRLICPNGQSLTLDLNDHGGGSFLGVPNHIDNGPDYCDPLVNPPGTPWVYGWSQLYPQQGTLNYLDFSTVTVPATDIYHHNNYLTPDSSFTALLGCPMNGVWKIEICDNWGSDNGWLFGWEAIYTGHSNIAGKVFYDIDSNGVQGIGEYGFEGQIVRLDTGSYLRVTDSNGVFEYCRDTATYTVSYTPPNFWNLTTDSSYTFTLTDPTVLYSGFNFGLKPQSMITDVAIQLTGSQTTAGNQESYWLSYQNLGTTSSSGTIHLTYDTLMSFVSSSLPPTSQLGNELTWDYDTLHVFESNTISLVSLMPGFTFVNQPLIVSCWISPTNGDVVLLNNYDTLNQVVSGPYDPNSKEVSPVGYGPSRQVLLGQRLSYTLHFQNVGNDTAHQVIIRDRLDTYMNPESFSLVASSHPLSYDFNDQGEVVFTFPLIMLPDSGTSQAGSQGFVSFNLSPDAGLVDSTVVTNRGSIYFDINPAVVTNEVVTTYVVKITASVEMVQKEQRLILFPNPFSTAATLRLASPVSDAVLIIYDIMGKEVKRYESLSGTNLTISRDQLKTGIYIFRLEDASGLIGSGKMVLE